MMITCKTHILRFIFLFALLLIAACVSQPRIWVEELPQYDALFDRQQGWTGADGAYSAALADDEILWLFGDTWYGKVRKGRHVDAIIINNSIAIQRGLMPPGASVEFYSGRTPAGKTRAFVQPADGRGWLWIYDGIRSAKGLYLFLIQLKRTESPNSFGFTIVETWLGYVPNPGDSPENWRWLQHSIPWGRFSTTGDTLFGSSLLKDNNYIYILREWPLMPGFIGRAFYG